MVYLSSKKARHLVTGDVVVKQIAGITKFFRIWRTFSGGVLVVQVTPDKNISHIFNPDGNIDEDNLGWLSAGLPKEVWDTGEGMHRLTLVAS